MLLVVRWVNPRYKLGPVRDIAIKERLAAKFIAPENGYVLSGEYLLPESLLPKDLVHVTFTDSYNIVR